MSQKAPSRLVLSCVVIISVLACMRRECEASVRSNNGSRSSINGMFVFGSSLVDNGNNNFLQNSVAKADYLPYGIDFPLGPSGRFTNGKNVIDLLGDKLNLPSFIPAFSDPQTHGQKILHGVNYASGASGILDDTGSLAGNVINLNHQIKNFEEVTMAEMREQMGSKSKESLANYLFVIGSGGNDYTFNYFLTGLSNNVSLPLFTSHLINAFSSQIKKLYHLGGRKFVLMSLNPLGCYPMVMMASHPSNIACNQPLNRAAQLFNSNLITLLHTLKLELPGSNLVFVNSYKIIRQIIKDPLSKGFRDAGRPCCVVPTLSEGGNGSLCKRGGETCKHRNSHVFFDGLHPTEAVNEVIAAKAFASNLNRDVYPINIQTLAQL